MSRQTIVRRLFSLLFFVSLFHSAIAQESLAPTYVITKAEYTIEVGPKPAASPSKKRVIKYAANVGPAAISELAADVGPLPTPPLAEKHEATDHRKAQVSATYHIYSLRAKRVEVPLLPPKLAVISSEIKRPSKSKGFLTDDARVGRSARGTVALLKGKSSVPHEIALKFFLDIEKEGPRNRITLPLGSSSTSRIKLDLPENDLAVKTTPTAPIRIVRKSGSTEAEINPPAADLMTIEWYPRALDKPVKPLIFVGASSLIHVSNGVFKRDVTFNYSIPRGADGIDAFQIMLPKKASVLQVKGEKILRWETVPPPEEKFADSVKILKVALESGLRSDGDSHEPKGTRRSLDERYAGVAYKLRVITEEITPSAPTTITFTPLKALGVNRQRGEIALLEDVRLSVKGVSATSARQLDINALDGATKAHRKEAKIAYLYDNYDGLPVEIAIRVEAIKPKIAAEVGSHARIEAGVITLTSRVSYDIREQGVYQFRAHFDDGLVPLSVRGENVKDWSFENQVVTVRLTSRAIGKYTLAIVSQQNLRKINGVVIPRIEALDATTETGYIGVIAGRGVNLQHFSSEKTKQRDVSELPEWIRKMGAKLAYSYDQKGGSLAVSTVEIKPEVSAKIYDFVGIEDDIVKREMLIVCDVAKAGKFDFKVDLPPDVIPTAVRGANIEDWTFKQADRQLGGPAARPTLWIDLQSEVRGKYQFEVVTERRRSDVAQDITLAAIKLEDTKKVEGWLGVGPRANIALRPKTQNGLTPLGIGQMPDVFKDYPEISLGYTFDERDWRIAFHTIKLDPKIEAETFSLLRFRAGQMTVKTEINYRISEARVNRLWLQLHKGATNVAIRGEGITEAEKDAAKNNLWRVSLDRQRKGDYKLEVTWQTPLKEERLAYQDIKLLRRAPVETEQSKEETAEAETAREDKDKLKAGEKLMSLPLTRHIGYIVVEKERPDVEISETSRGDKVDTLDPSRIPAALSQKINIPIAAYRYSITAGATELWTPELVPSGSLSEQGSPWEVAFRITSHNIAEVAQAVAPECMIQTIVKRDGEAISYLSCQLHNTNQQFLEVELPKDSDLWGTYISGEPVKPKEDVVDGGRGGKYLIPILNSGKHGSDFSVDMIWRQPVSKPRIIGLGLKAPRFLNLNVDHIDWQVFMPEEYQILGYGGNLKMAGFRPGDVSLVGLAAASARRCTELIFEHPFSTTAIAILIIFFAVQLGVKSRRGVRIGFIELLIVIAIISVLASMLMPPLSRARSKIYDRLERILPGSGAATEEAVGAYEMKLKTPASEEKAGAKVSFADGHVKRRDHRVGPGGYNGNALWGDGKVEDLYKSKAFDRFGAQVATIGVKRRSARTASELSIEMQPTDKKVAVALQGGVGGVAGMMMGKEAPAGAGMMPGGQTTRGEPGTPLPPKPPAKTAPSKSELDRQGISLETPLEPQAQDEGDRAAAEVAQKQQKIVEKQRKLSAQTHYQFGNEYYNKGDYTSAAKEFAKALELDSTLDQARRKRDKVQRLSEMLKTKRQGEVEAEQLPGKQARPFESRRVLEEADMKKSGESLENLDLGVLASKHETLGKRAVKQEYDISDLAKDLGKGDIKEGRKKLAKMIQRSFGEAGEPAKTKRVAGRPATAKGKQSRMRQKIAEKGIGGEKEELAHEEYERRELKGKAGRAKGDVRGAAIKGGKLIVTDSREVQGQVVSFLKRLRKERSEIRLAQAKRLREERYESRKRFARKQSEMQRLETPRAVAANVIGGKARGALPILLELPTTGTVAYQFEKPVVGETRPEIRLHCIRRGAALFLQSMIALIIFAGIGASAYKSRKLAAAIIIAAGIILCLIQVLSSSALKEYFSVALYALAISLVVLAIHALWRTLSTAK